MSLFKEIQDLTNKIDYALLLEPEEGKWCTSSVFLYYTYKDDVYDGDIREGEHTQRDCVFINTDNGSGFTITKVLKTDNMLTYQEFEELYGDQMYG